MLQRIIDGLLRAYRSVASAVIAGHDAVESGLFLVGKTRIPLLAQRAFGHILLLGLADVCLEDLLAAGAGDAFFRRHLYNLVAAQREFVRDGLRESREPEAAAVFFRCNTEIVQPFGEPCMKRRFPVIGI